jgi:transcriptional regulator with GAF, ATPase, and Fis domain
VSKLDQALTAAAKIVPVHEMDAVICSPSMTALMSMVARVAPRDAAVLITGETGTGKELIARAVHAQSLRANRPWVDVNCAALPEHLVESELFGYEKGAFSGADTGKPGLFELADKGTLFLDEIGELEPRVQVKLLRVLDGVPYYRLGGSRKIAVDVRIIAATNQPLDQAVKQARFRSDLYHRLSQLQLRIPPLRERSEDIVALAQYFLDKTKPGLRLSFGATDVMQSYSWPGNVRELRNVVLQAAISAASDEISLSDLPAEILCSPAPETNCEVQASATAEHESPADLDELERRAIIRTLDRTGGHQGMAAEQLGISRRTLSRKLKQYRIENETLNLGVLSGREQQYFRASLAIPVTIVSRHGEQVVTTVNVSTGGMAIEGVSDPFHLAGSLTLAFAIPGLGETLSARAQIVWADPSGRAGLRFVTMDQADSMRLRHWLQQRQAEEGWSVPPAPDSAARLDAKPKGASVCSFSQETH